MRIDGRWGLGVGPGGGKGRGGARVGSRWRQGTTLMTGSTLTSGPCPLLPTQVENAYFHQKSSTVNHKNLPQKVGKVILGFGSAKSRPALTLRTIPPPHLPAPCLGVNLSSGTCLQLPSTAKISKSSQVGRVSGQNARLSSQWPVWSSPRKPLT